MNFKEFRARSCPEKSVFERAQFDFTTNLVKCLAIRFGYILFKLKISANLLNVIAILLTFSGLCLLFRATSGNITYFLCGMALIYFQIFVDFVDGAIAKAQGTTGIIGHAFDNIGCDLTRSALLVLLGMYTQNFLIILANLFSGIILFFFLPQTLKELPTNGIINICVKFYTHKLSLMGVRFLLAILPVILGCIILNNGNLNLLSLAFSILYMTMAFFWLMICIPHYQVKTGP